MQFAGYAEAARRILFGLFFVAGTSAGTGARAQTPEALEWYAKGLAALEARRYVDAQADLQRAVQADPTFAGAWLDLAIAAHGAGDSAQAEEFLRILQDRFVLPPAIEAGILALQQRIAQASEPADAARWTWRGMAQLGAGHDTNANAGLLTRDLTLTFPGGGVTLPVADALRPRADSYLLGAVSAEGRSRRGEGQLEISASARVRRNGQASQFDTLEWQAGVAYESAAALAPGMWAEVLPGPWRVSATAQQAQLGGKVLFNSLVFSGVHAWRSLKCSPQAGLDLDIRGFPQARNLDSLTTWLSLSASCPADWITRDGAWNLRARAGRESARDASSDGQGRPGGDTTHMELSLARHWTWAGKHGTHQVEVLGQWAAAQDSQGYSPLLSSNARRSVRRWTAAVAYTVPLWAEGWAATLTIQGFRQRSNLELFRIQGEVFQVTVQKSW